MNGNTMTKRGQEGELLISVVTGLIFFEYFALLGQGSGVALSLE